MVLLGGFQRCIAHSVEAYSPDSDGLWCTDSCSDQGLATVKRRWKVSRGVYRTIVLAVAACAALVYCAVTVFGATADTLLHHLLFSVLMVALAASAAVVVFIIRRIFSGSR